MASNVGSSGFSKGFSKHAQRAKERLLQNFGKADKTTDETFNTYVNNFGKQQTLALKLQKELKNYVTCVRAMQAANKGLMDTLSEIYEQEWIGHEQIPVKAQATELIWEDFGHKLHDQVSIPLNTYLSQFSEIRGKIAKRGRKLVDYDSCRHNVEALIQTTNKKKDEMKITKAREQLEEAKRLYECIHCELHDELPALYDSRIPFLVSNLQTMFTAETVFHVENSKIYSQLSELMEKLAFENQRGTYILRKSGSPKIQRGDSDVRHYEEIEFKKNSNMEHNSEFTLSDMNGDSRSPSAPSSPTKPAEESVLNHSDSFHTPITTSRPERTPKVDKEYEPVEVNEQNHLDNGTSPSKQPMIVDPKKVEELYDIPVGATTTDLPAGVLYRVRATYKYAAEDVDELSFEMGEIIRVTEFEDPEEQEEGWLMGMKESAPSEKGLFPANFTRPI